VSGVVREIESRVSWSVELEEKSVDDERKLWSRVSFIQKKRHSLTVPFGSLTVIENGPG
jgi:hypothetical protein